MACPYFVPEKRCEAELWQHRGRLPLGDGYEGRCSAPGHEQAKPSEEELKFGCNLGNALCSRLPEDRTLDSVRFYIASDDGQSVAVNFCTERDHHPREHGMLRFDTESGKFVAATAGPSIIRLAEAFVQSHLARHPRKLAALS